MGLKFLFNLIYKERVKGDKSSKLLQGLRKELVKLKPNTLQHFANTLKESVQEQFFPWFQGEICLSDDCFSDLMGHIIAMNAKKKEEELYPLYLKAYTILMEPLEGKLSTLLERKKVKFKICTCNSDSVMF